MIEEYYEKLIHDANEEEYVFEKKSYADNYDKYTEYLDSIDSYGFDDLVERVLPDFQEVFWENKEVVASSCFSFFEKDSFDHIKLNGHNLSNPTTYAYSLQRTPKMEKLRDLLMGIDLGEEKEKCLKCYGKGSTCGGVNECDHDGSTCSMTSNCGEFEEVVCVFCEGTGDEGGKL